MNVYRVSIPCIIERISPPGGDERAEMDIEVHALTLKMARDNVAKTIQKLVEERHGKEKPND